MIKTFNVSLPKELVDKIDNYAKSNYMSRSELIKHSVIKQINSQENWVTVADFTKVSKSGVSAKQILQSIEKLENDRQNSKVFTKFTP
jgi:metal-responsive CopG/Arc/MetJ family transcriptional regulator